MAIAKVGTGVNEEFTVSVEAAESATLNDITNSLACNFCGIDDFESL